jgi:hypothetical protein
MKIGNFKILGTSDRPDITKKGIPGPGAYDLSSSFVKLIAKPE